MRNLVESILSDDLLAASEVFESHIAEIMEKKLYEKKRMMQAEAFGGMSKHDIERRKKAGFIKASDYYDAMDKLKEIKRKAESDIKPEKKKKKISEAFTGTGSGSKEELEKRAKGAAQRLGTGIGQAAAARQARIEREIAKRKESGKKGVAYTKTEPVSKGPETAKPTEPAPKIRDVKKDRETELKWMTQKGREKAKAERRSQEISRHQQTSPQRAARLQSRLKDASFRDTARNVAKKSAGLAKKFSGSSVGQEIASWSNLEEQNN